jgi:hypothetical protein
MKKHRKAYQMTKSYNAVFTLLKTQGIKIRKEDSTAQATQAVQATQATQAMQATSDFIAELDKIVATTWISYTTS